jgi:hypothetical protein
MIKMGNSIGFEAAATPIRRRVPEDPQDWSEPVS